jgi:hypothetical protein
MARTLPSVQVEGEFSQQPLNGLCQLKGIRFSETRVGGSLPKGAVQLLARNEAPQVSYQGCRIHAATRICSEYAWNGGLAL